MSWRDIAFNDIILFLKVWKSREEIQEHFKLSSVESWHMVKFLSKMKGDIMVQSQMGKTRRSKMYCARKTAYNKAVHDNAQYIISKPITTGGELNEIRSIDGKGKRKNNKSGDV
jgi:hypothetical protein